MLSHQDSRNAGLQRLHSGTSMHAGGSDWIDFGAHCTSLAVIKSTLNKRLPIPNSQLPHLGQPQVSVKQDGVALTQCPRLLHRGSHES